MTRDGCVQRGFCRELGSRQAQVVAARTRGRRPVEINPAVGAGHGRHGSADIEQAVPQLRIAQGAGPGAHDFQSDALGQHRVGHQFERNGALVEGVERIGVLVEGMDIGREGAGGLGEGQDVSVGQVRVAQLGIARTEEPRRKGSADARQTDVAMEV